MYFIPDVCLGHLYHKDIMQLGGPHGQVTSWGSKAASNIQQHLATMVH